MVNTIDTTAALTEIRNAVWNASCEGNERPPRETVILASTTPITAEEVEVPTHQRVEPIRGGGFGDRNRAHDQGRHRGATTDRVERGNLPALNNM